MADRITEIILAGLRRAVREPGGLPLLASRKSPGLFPATAAGRQAATRACAERLLDVRSADSPNYFLTELGHDFLTVEMHPREVLEDIARAVEARGMQLTRLIAAAEELHNEWRGLQSLIGRLTSDAPAELQPAADEVCEILAEWNAPGDCPLPELFQRLTRSQPALTVGAFHDSLRQLHHQERIYLHPWTGPLYTLPEPAFALLIGHEVAYYASRRSIVGYPTNDANSRDSRNTPVNHLQRATA